MSSDKCLQYTHSLDRLSPPAGFRLRTPVSSSGGYRVSSLLCSWVVIIFAIHSGIIGEHEDPVDSELSSFVFGRKPNSESLVSLFSAASTLITLSPCSLYDFPGLHIYHIKDTANCSIIQFRNSARLAKWKKKKKIPKLNFPRKWGIYLEILLKASFVFCSWNKVFAEAVKSAYSKLCSLCEDHLISSGGVSSHDAMGKQLSSALTMGTPPATHYTHTYTRERYTHCFLFSFFSKLLSYLVYRGLLNEENKNLVWLHYKGKRVSTSW